jgi:hypothetical protein
MAERKSFFKERTVAEIMDLNKIRAYKQKNLIKKISDLDPSNDCLELRVRILPGRFFIGMDSTFESAKKCYKHGDLISLTQPKTQKEAYDCKEIPLAIRQRDFISELQRRREEDIHVLGYSWYPVQGNDRRKRVVHFNWCPEALRVYGYAETIANGIEVNAYADAKRVKKEGADIVCTVPSRTKKRPRYVVKLQHVPVDGSTERRAVIWSLGCEREAPLHSIYNIRYTWETDRESSDRLTFYPHDIAAYIAVAAYYSKQHNLTPMEMSPFALFSKKGADIYKKLCNNVLLFDPTKNSKDNLRKPYIAEKDILLARAIGIFGPNEIAFWDFESGRDGRLSNYNWSIK